MKIRYILVLFFISIVNLTAQDFPTPGELEALGNYIDLGNEVVDLNGNGITDVINLVVHNEDGDLSNFVLMINQQDIKGKHSYNVDRFIVIDLDKNDKQKEVAIHTPNPNGPDEYIIYKYDGSAIKQIGRTYSTTVFRGDGTVEVITYMPFWDKNDTYFYDREKDELTWVEKDRYDIDIECKVIDKMAVHHVVNSRGFDGFLNEGQTIKIMKAKVKDCDKTGPYYWGLCDEFYYVADDGREGWATMEEMMGKIDLPLLP